MRPSISIRGFVRPSVGRSVGDAFCNAFAFILHSSFSNAFAFILHSSFGNAILQKEDASIGHTWPCFRTVAFFLNLPYPSINSHEAVYVYPTGCTEKNLW